MQVVRNQKKMEPYPLYNRARARYALDTRTNRCVLDTHTNYQAYEKIAPEVHSVLAHSLKRTFHRIDVTPLLPGDV